MNDCKHTIKAMTLGDSLNSLRQYAMGRFVESTLDLMLDEYTKREKVPAALKWAFLTELISEEAFEEFIPYNRAAELKKAIPTLRVWMELMAAHQMDEYNTKHKLVPSKIVENEENKL